MTSSFILKCVSFLLMFPRGMYGGFTAGIFEEISIFGTDLVASHKKIFKAVSIMSCALACLRERGQLQSCLAFAYHPLDKTCDFYTTEYRSFSHLTTRVFLFKVTDTFHDISIGDKHFNIYVSSSLKTYADSRTYCNKIGGYLIQFDSLEERQAMNKILAEQTLIYFYVGANDIDEEGHWVTDKDNKPLDLSFWSWRQNAPDNSYKDEHCAVIESYPPNNMEDVPCHYEFAFICERDG